jgi:exodeoxyribonuclease-3
VRIVTWNIRHGGPRGAAFQRIIDTLLGFDADLLVVTEFRAHERGAALVAALRRAGYDSSEPGAPADQNAVLIASRGRLGAARPLDPALPQPWLLWTAEAGWGRLCGAYMPGETRKLPYFEATLRALAQPDAPCLLIGDLNTGRNDLDKADGATPFVGEHYMTRLEEAGYRDLWRAQHGARREYSWFSNPWNNGFRLDHAFGTAAIAARMTSCRYDHEPRLRGASDHSALVLELGP